MNSKGLLEAYYKEEYKNWVGRVRSRGCTVDDAEDIVQEAFATALTYLHTFNPALSNFPTWFTRILNQTQKKMSRDVLASTEIKEEDIFTDEADDYEGGLQEYRIIKEMIKNTPKENHRNILWLHFISNLKVGEVSKQLGEPVETVKTTVKRFKRKVREKLDAGGRV